jgi:hypothetical protein
VGAGDRVASRDVVAVGELLVDRDPEPAEGVAVALDHLLEAVGAANLPGMQDVVARDDVVEGVEVALRRILEARSNRRLVLPCCHLLPPRVV